ncbi:MAG: hypothetical protein Kow0065_04950 [Methylomicrobium sp.]
MVEDDELDEALVVSTLERDGLSFEHALVQDEENFRIWLDIRPWDVIVSDYNLPIFSAYEVLEILEERGLDIPCIVISGCLDEQAAVTLMKKGAYDFIPKSNLCRLAPAILREINEARNRAEKRRVEQDLRQKEKLLTNIAGALGEGLAVTDAQGRVLFINPEAERLLGWHDDEIGGQNLHELIHYMKADGSAYLEHECPVATFTRQGVPYRSEDEVFVRRDGSCFAVSYVATPIFDDGRVEAVVTAFHDISRRKQAERELTESRSRLRELSNFLQSVREEERARIARELHDELGQALTALKMDLTWLLARFADDQDDLVVKTDNMITLVDSTVDAMRRISANLRPGLLDDLGLAAAAEWLLAEFEERTGIPYTLNKSHDEFAFDNELGTTVFRILQEAVTNVARHARARRLDVMLEDRGEIVMLSVKDDGIGLVPQADAGKRKSFGLLGIRERVTSLGGQIEITGPAGQGTEVRVVLPKKLNTETLTSTNDKSTAG